MATVVAKNAVGSSWRKIMGTREWSRVPDAEKAYVRTTSTACLLSEPSSRVAVQLALLISNLARFDVPRPWDSLVGDLAASAGMDSPTSLESKLRSLRALKHCVRGLKDAEKAYVRTTSTACLLSEPSSRVAVQLALLISNLARFDVPRPWDSLVGDLAASAGMDSPTSLESKLRSLRALKHCVRGLKGKRFAIDTPNILMSLSDNAVTALTSQIDTDRGQLAAQLKALLPSMQAGTKSRVLLTRFTARVLIQPMYRPDFINLHAQGFGVLTSAYDRSQRYLPSLTAAQEALDGLLAPGQCSALVQAVVTKYIALSSEELEEWQADAEGFARQVDVETSPDADTPRPCGVALLECMLERETESVSSALVEAAGQLQTAPLTRETLLLREATYRALGECFSHVRTKVDFPNWYETELRGILQPTPNAGLDAHILQARALWLVGVCGEELGHEPWDEAFGLCAAHISSPDLVVALMAVSACTAMVAQALEESAFLSQAPERHRMRERLFLDGFGDFDEAPTASRCWTTGCACGAACCSTPPPCRPCSR
ncbi:Importin-11 [Auxenochlorella protothecoides]|uniref:Importin-11 n=1 Tax=Auxenochlorella protothecoides TaxID=3075 RepID=A0A087SPD1_AUXPR|nr:Importin-11 [Auxenochlorella protothecoides]KFM27585.1 Importin-11 [Auxenochlorella protothecoides]